MIVSAAKKAIGWQRRLLVVSGDAKVIVSAHHLPGF